MKFICSFSLIGGAGRLSRAWLVEGSRGGGRENLATHLPIRDLSIYVSSEANRKHFLCLASNLWPVTGPTLSTHSLFQPPLLLTPYVHSPLVVHSAYTVSGVFNAISDFACSAFQICLTNIWPIRNSAISARKYRYEARTSLGRVFHVVKLQFSLRVLN